MGFEEAADNMLYNLSDVFDLLGFDKKELVPDYFAGVFEHPFEGEIILRKMDLQKYEKGFLEQIEESRVMSDEGHGILLAALSRLRAMVFDIEPEWVGAWAVSKDLGALLHERGEMIIDLPDPVWLCNSALEEIFDE